LISTAIIFVRLVLSKIFSVVLGSRLRLPRAMADIKRWTVSEPYLQIDCSLGEAPYYEKNTNRLRFVDILKEKLHVIDLKEGPSSLKTFDLESAVGFVHGPGIYLTSR